MAKRESLFDKAQQNLLKGVPQGSWHRCYDLVVETKSSISGYLGWTELTHCDHWRYFSERLSEDPSQEFHLKSAIEYLIEKFKFTQAVLERLRRMLHTPSFPRVQFP